MLAIGIYYIERSSNFSHAGILQTVKKKQYQKRKNGGITANVKYFYTNITHYF